MRVALALPVLCLMGTLAQQAQAGFISLNWSFPGNVATHDDEGVDLAGGTGYGAKAWVTATRLALGNDDHVLSGSTDSDPLVWIEETIINDTSYPWYGYVLAITTPDASFVNAGQTTSSPLTVTGFSASEIEMGTPGGPVMPGQSLTLSYYVNIDTTGPFSITLAHFPIVPEPAAIGLLGLGGLALLMRRR